MLRLLVYSPLVHIFGALDLGKWIHKFIRRSKAEVDLFLLKIKSSFHTNLLEQHLRNCGGDVESLGFRLIRLECGLFLLKLSCMLPKFNLYLRFLLISTRATKRPCLSFRCSRRSFKNIE